MRVSVLNHDRGFPTWCNVLAHAQRVHVLFNGELQTGCITADTDCGMIVRMLVGDDGNYIYDADRETFVDEVVHGKVEIEIYRPEVL